jgi:hypothetical protein
MPFDFAYRSNSHVTLEVLETMVDIVFFFDIVINFRTIYFSSLTNDKITEPIKIAKNYIFSGRFFIDLIASVPVDLFLLMVNSSNNRAFSIIKILKLTRLFRLNKIVSFIRYKVALRSSLKMVLIV